MFFWNSLAFAVIQRMLTIWSLVPLPFLNPAWISGISHTVEAWLGEFWALLCYHVAIYMEKAMAPHSSTLAWKLPWTEEPGSLQSMGSLRVGHDWVTSLLPSTFMHWRRKWQPTSVLAWRILGMGGAWWAAIYGVAQSQTQLTWLNSSSSYICVCVYIYTYIYIWRKWQPTTVHSPGKSHGRRSMAVYDPCGCKESDTTEWLHFTSYIYKMYV